MGRATVIAGQAARPARPYSGRLAAVSAFIDERRAGALYPEACCRAIWLSPYSSALVWASNFVIAKLVLADLHIPPLFFSAVRLALVLVALAVSVFGHTVYFVLIRKYEANLIAPLTRICPLMAIGLGLIITGDHFDGRMAIGTVVVLVGVLLIFLAPRHGRASS